MVKVKLTEERVRQIVKIMLQEYEDRLDKETDKLAIKLTNKIIKTMNLSFEIWYEHQKASHKPFIQRAIDWIRSKI